MVRMLALPAPGCDEDKVSVVVCGFCPGPTQKAIQPAGRAFHAVHEKPKIEAKKGGKSKKEDKSKDSDDEQDSPQNDAWRNKKKKEGANAGSLKLSPNLEGQDLYAIMEVTESASLDAIKKQYRKMVLIHHPDKRAEGEDADAKSQEEKNAHFIKIQEAYEVLSEPSKRRMYDSTLEFDDSVPEEVVEKQGFYGTFAPVFARNGRWSNRQPVPELGDESTDMSKVHKFYDFWLNFDTWRDFSMHDEYNLEDADCREERRWMDRMNARDRKKLDADERKRILKLTETAERLDPRICAERDAAEAKKREEKERRAKERQDAEEAKARAVEEKRLEAERLVADKEEKERQERDQRKEKNQAAKSLRQRLKKAVQARCKLSTDEMEELQDMCLGLDSEQLEDVCGRLEALDEKAKEKAEALVRSEFAQFRKRKIADEEEQARQREAAKAESEKAKAAAKEAEKALLGAWQAEELSILAKGLQKFPGGTGGRWALITQMLNALGHMRSEKEVVEKTKELSDGASLRSVGTTVLADANMSTFQAPSAKAKAKAAPAAPAAKAAEPAAPAAAGYPAEKPAEASSEWSPEQQKKLEAALAKYPATMDKNERWKAIAEEVPGKKKSECVERFKYLREQIANQKK